VPSKCPEAPIEIVSTRSTPQSKVMFMPGQPAKDPKAEAYRKAGIARVEEWSMALIPENIRRDVVVAVQEVQCGDPNCAPIDTAITIVFSRCGRILCLTGDFPLLV